MGNDMSEMPHARAFHHDPLPAADAAASMLGSVWEIAGILPLSVTLPSGTGFTLRTYNGEDEEPLYTYLKEQQPDEEVKGLKNKAAMKAIEAEVTA